MLDELIILFSQVEADAPPAAYRAAVREHNCLGKRSGCTRQLTARHLAELYGLNIRPFVTVPDVKKKGAGVLVYKPNIHWKKDCGKDLESAPGYNLGPQLGEAKGARINDYYLTLAAKKAARKP